MSSQQATSSPMAITPSPSFLLGQVDTFSIDLQISRSVHVITFKNTSCRMTGRSRAVSAANIGARHTLHFPSTEKNNQGAVFNLATQQLDYLGVNGYPKSARELHDGNVAPRASASPISSRRRPSFCSGFGIVFIDQSGITTPFTTPQFPFSSRMSSRRRRTASMPPSG